MAYDEQQTKQSRVVVETPTARREVSRTEHEYSPNNGGTSTATIAVVVILAVGVVVLLLLLVMNKQANDNANLAAQQAAQPVQQPPVVVQQPAAQQPPIIVQQPAAAPASQAPIIVNPPASGGTTNPNVPDDTSIQAEVEKRIQKDTALSTLGLTVSVLNGKALLVGTVNSDALKRQAEKVVMAVKGVKSVDNQIIVTAS
ncbi:MAG TPA: BON domain-containing protein [Pyrinomonadaceae bacterium]|nr:BON domain-containing protein [Pyrinomonadaceae bacterium]